MSTLTRRRPAHAAHAAVNWMVAAVTAGAAEALAAIIIVGALLLAVGLWSLFIGEMPVLELDLWRLLSTAAAIPLSAKA